MQATWSVVLNVLLLIGVIIVISRMMKARKQQIYASSVSQAPSIGQPEKSNFDDIIAIRKVSRSIPDDVNDEPSVQPALQPKIQPEKKTQSHASICSDSTAPSVMMFLLAKGERQLAGYELLQTVLASGLRFGEGQLFHRHQYPNGQGPVLCSLAAATPTGVFDLQNIGAFSVRGLCLFMQASGNATIDAERFEIMLDTAKQLSEGLDTHLLDEHRKPLTDASIQHYYRMLNLYDVKEQFESA
jgi:cell division protein ZipA